MGVGEGSCVFDDLPRCSLTCSRFFSLHGLSSLFSTTQLSKALSPPSQLPAPPLWARSLLGSRISREGTLE
jgi:hypothetical protein